MRSDCSDMFLISCTCDDTHIIIARTSSMVKDNPKVNIHSIVSQHNTVLCHFGLSLVRNICVKSTMRVVQISGTLDGCLCG